MAKLGTEVPQFFENGVPCAGYVMYFGQPNQDPKTNPKSPYADAAFSAALDENLTLDANGLFASREIFLSGSYSLRLERADGTLYWALESIEGFQGDGSAVTTTYVDAKVLEEISKNDMFHNDSSLNSGLSFSVGAYRVSRANGAVWESTSTTNVTMNDDVTEALVFNVDDGMFYKVDTDSIESNHLHLFNVTTLSGSITTASIVDKRSHIDARNRFTAGYVGQNKITKNAVDPDHDIDFAIGRCASSDGKMDMYLATAMTKQLDATWSAGNNAGGLFSGSIAPSTTYYGFIISDSDGTADCGFDTSVSAANKPADYAHYKLRFTFDTDGSSNIDFDTFVDYEKCVDSLLLENGSVSTIKMADAAVTPDKIAALSGSASAGDVGIASGAGLFSDATVAIILRFTIVRDGTYRIAAQSLLTSASSGTADISVTEGITTILTVNQTAVDTVVGNEADRALSAGDVLLVSLVNRTGTFTGMVCVSISCSTADDLTDRVSSGAINI